MFETEKKISHSEAMKRWRAKNKERIAEYYREWVKKSPRQRYNKDYYINQELRKARKDKKSFTSEQLTAGFRRIIEISKQSDAILDKMLACAGAMEHDGYLKESNALQRKCVKLRRQFGIYQE